LVQNGLAVTFCALGSYICASPSVAILDASGGGQNLVNILVPGSADCLDLAGAVLNSSGLVLGLGSGPGTRAGPEIKLFCRFSNASAVPLFSTGAVSVLMTDSSTFIDVPVTAIDITSQRLVCITFC
jgi:hypothetical protein